MNLIELLHHDDFTVMDNNANDISNDRLKEGRVTSLKKVYCISEIFSMDLCEGETSENW